MLPRLYAQTERFVRVVGGFSSQAAAVTSVTTFMYSERGIDLDAKHTEGDFSNRQLMLLTFLMMAIGLILTFASVAPSQFTAQHLAKVLTDSDDLKLCACAPFASGLGIPYCTLTRTRVGRRSAAWHADRSGCSAAGVATSVLEGQMVPGWELCVGGAGFSLLLHRFAPGHTQLGLACAGTRVDDCRWRGGLHPPHDSSQLGVGPVDTFRDWCGLRRRLCDGGSVHGPSVYLAC